MRVGIRKPRPKKRVVDDGRASAEPQLGSSTTTRASLPLLFIFRFTSARSMFVSLLALSLHISCLCIPCNLFASPYTLHHAPQSPK